MPPILTATIRSDSQRGSTDRTQLCVVLAVVGIVLIQTFLAIAYIRFHNLSSKARWRRLRERGVVFVNGPALIWTNTLPPAPLTSTAVSAACCFKPNRNFAPLCHRTVASRSPTHTSARYTSMSLFTFNSTPIPGSFRKRQSVPETVIILIIVTAVGLSVVVGFVLFVIWFRMKKRREQHEAAIQLEELTHTGNSLGRPAEHEIGVAR
ncbi:hypothetical protein PTNB73_09771 [Pyrenophora teres f. teres]|nr:hypothetical protein HRS9122_08540 [Pyrenophora teres f. teres]KAE8856506.1 hypothetical protein PTNB73_09771 [Pyrenophora teres f. teres]